LDRLEREYDNLRAALDWCVSEEDPEAARLGLRLGSALWFFWTVRGHIKEGRGRLARLLALAGAQGTTAARAKALTSAGWLAWFNSDGPAALRALEESLGLCRELGDASGVARALAVTGLALAVYTDELARARRVLDEALERSRAVEEPWAMGYSAYGLGHLAARLGDTRGARQWFEQSLALRRQAGNRWGEAYSLYRLSLLALEHGDVARASALQSQSLSLSWALRNKRGMAVSAEVLACLAGIQGRAERAARLFGVATALLDAANYLLPPTLFELHKRGEGAARGDLGDAAFETLYDEGRGLPIAEGVALALAEPEAPRRQPIKSIHGGAAPGPGLTEREREVARLVAQGLTDRQVATRLRISPRTVDGHLRRIFTKLGAPSRAAVAAWAVQQHVA
jgi:non-specific serine/threonine protein kinase